MKIAMLHTTIRTDEKLLIKAAKSRNVNLECLDVRNMILDIDNDYDYDIVLERCISTTKGNYGTSFFESLNISVVNSSAVARVCQDKYLTSLALAKDQIPAPDFTMVFDLGAARTAIEQIGGFPVVIKPTIGSWGRLLSKVNDFDALETILEHKQVLGSPHHKAFYIQKYIEKKGADIRAFVINGKVICAILRRSDHWITNTARGAVAENFTVDKRLEIICRQASDAVGGGILAIDLMELNGGYTINEINHTMEFKNSETPTGVSISGAIIDYCLKIAKQNNL